MTEQQKDFVHMYLKHRDKIIAHNIAYGNNPNYDSVESSANRLLRIPEIADTIRSIQDNIRHEVEEEFKAKYREELLSIYDKRMLLKRIATGELYVEQKYKGKNCTQCSQYISPTINQMLAAIREDNKLAGHHPHKVAGKWVIPALQVEQQEKPSENTLDNTSPSGAGGEKDNNRQQIEVLSPATVSLPPQVDGAGRSLPADGGGTLAQEYSPEKENKRQETWLSPAGGGVSLPADGGGTLAQENSPEKENKRQHPAETNTDNQPLTNSLETSVDSSGNIISQEKLRELLYPQKPKLSYMKNNP